MSSLDQSLQPQQAAVSQAQSAVAGQIQQHSQYQVAQTEEEWQHRVQVLEKQVQSLLKVKNELENAVTEMCEDIRDKDEAVDKAAKIIEMLRTDVHEYALLKLQHIFNEDYWRRLEKSVEDIIQSEQQRDHLKEMVKELEQASSEQVKVSETNAELQRMLELRDDELTSLKAQMKNLRISYSNEIDSLRRTLHAQSRFTPAPVHRTKAPGAATWNNKSSLVPSPLGSASVTTRASTSASLPVGSKLNKHVRSSSLTMSSKRTAVSSPLSCSIPASPTKQSIWQQLPQQNSSSAEATYLMNEIEKIVEIESVEMKENESTEELESLLDSFIVQIDRLSTQLAKEIKTNAALSGLVREQQIVQRLTSREVNEQKILLEVVTKMLGENVDDFESDLRINTQMENESRSRRSTEMERLARLVSRNSCSYFELVLSVKAAVLLDEIERALNERIGSTILNIPFSEKRKQKVLKQSEVELVLEAVIDQLNRSDIPGTVAAARGRMPSTQQARRLHNGGVIGSGENSSAAGRDKFEGEPAEGEELVDFLRNRIDALLEVFGFMEIEFENTKSRNKELEMQVISLESLLRAAASATTAQTHGYSQDNYSCHGDNEAGEHGSRRRLAKEIMEKDALGDENQRLHELIREQRVEIEHLSVKVDDEGVKFALLNGEHVKAMGLADQALLDLDNALRAKETLERENAQLNCLVQEYQRLMIKCEDSMVENQHTHLHSQLQLSSQAHQAQLEGEVAILRDQLNEQYKVNSELRKSVSMSSTTSECSSEFREVLLAAIRCFSSGLLHSRFPIPQQNLDILMESRPTLRTFVEALLSFQSSLSNFSADIVALFNERMPPESLVDFTTLIRRNIARIRSESESELSSLKRQVQELLKQNQARTEEFRRREDQHDIERELQRTQVELIQQQQQQQQYQQTLRLQQSQQQQHQQFQSDQSPQNNHNLNHQRTKQSHSSKSANPSSSSQQALQQTSVHPSHDLTQNSMSPHASLPKSLKFKQPSNHNNPIEASSSSQEQMPQTTEQLSSAHQVLSSSSQQQLNQSVSGNAGGVDQPSLENFLRFCRMLNSMAEQLISLTNNRDNLLLERASSLPQSKNLMTAQFQLCLLNLLSNWKKSVLDTSNLFHQLSVYLKSLIANLQHPQSVFVPVLDIDSHVAILAKQSFFQEVMLRIEQLDDYNEKGQAESKSRTIKVASHHQAGGIIQPQSQSGINPEAKSKTNSSKQKVGLEVQSLKPFTGKEEVTIPTKRLNGMNESNAQNNNRSILSTDGQYVVQKQQQQDQQKSLLLQQQQQQQQQQSKNQHSQMERRNSSSYGEQAAATLKVGNRN